MEHVNYTRATICRLGTVLTRARSRLSTAQPGYKSGLDRKVSFCPIIIARDFTCVERLPRALTEADKRETERSEKNITDASR